MLIMMLIAAIRDISNAESPYELMINVCSYNHYLPIARE